MGRRDGTPWDVIQASLDSYHPAQIATLLREYLTPRVPPGTRKLAEDTRKAMAEDLKALLEANLGPWYTETGVYLGNESLGGYCWCHSFFNERPTPNLGVEHNVQRMLKGLGHAHGWLSQLDALFQALKRDMPSAPGDEDIRALALAEAMVRAVELTESATACEEAWYVHAEDALGWLLQSQGLRLDHKAAKLWRSAFQFESWVSPPADILRDGAEQVALATIEAEGHRRARK